MLKLFKNSPKVNKTFLLYFWSYMIVIIFIIVAIGIFSYGLSINILEEELSKSNTNALKQTSLSVHNLLKDIDSLSIQLGLDGRIYGYAKNIENHFLINDITDTVKDTARTNENIHSIEIYFQKNSAMISSTGATHLFNDAATKQ